MFAGQAQYSVDAKGRVPVSPEHRKGLTGEVVLMPGYDPCIWILNAEVFKSARETLANERNIFNPKALRLQRRFLGSAHTTELDKQGRLRVPDLLRELIGLTDDNNQVVMVGAGNRIECWAKDRWLQYQQAELTEAHMVEDARVLGLWHDDDGAESAQAADRHD